LRKRWSIPLIIFALMISFSRLYIGIHHPTDVLFGIVDGLLLALIAWMIERRMNRSVVWYQRFTGEKREEQQEA